MVETAGRRDVCRVDVINARTGRTAAQRHFESHHRLGIALGNDFDAAVVLVADIAAKAFAPGGVFGKHPEAHPLDPAFYDVAAPDDHPPRDYTRWAT